MIKFFLLFLFFIPNICIGAITAVASTPTLAAVTSGANFTITSPTGTTTNDVLVFIFAERSGTDGVTRIDDNGGSGGHTFTNQTFVTGASTSGVSVWYHVVGSSDGTTWTVTNTQNGEAGLMAYRGVDTTTPIDASGTSNTGNSSTFTFNAVTTVTAYAWYIGGFSENINAATGLTFSSGSPTPTIRTDTGNGGTTTKKNDLGIIDASEGAGSSTGTYVYTGTSNVWTTYSFALRAASTSHFDTIAGGSTIRGGNTIQ